MCSFIVTNVINFMLEYINFYLKPRGPDYTNVFKKENFSFIHNLLHITGKKVIQPFVQNQIICLYNGEIYNYKEFGNYNSDGECLIDLYNKYGSIFTKKLDGEFALVLFDFKLNKIIISNDTFACKPLYYALNEKNIGFASYKSALIRLKLENVIKLEANKTKVFDLNTFKLLSEFENYKFDLKQFKTNFDDWNISFENSIKKRCLNSPYDIFVCMSSGYDSGSICCALNKLGVKYHTFTVIGKEDKRILKLRRRKNSKFTKSTNEYKIHWKTLRNERKFDCEHFSMQTTRELYNIKNDDASAGMSFICKEAKKKNIRIYLSGQGADEIISDYSMNSKGFYKLDCFKGLFPDNLEDIFPKNSLDDNCIWKNFYNNFQKAFLAKEECISGMHGIEGRYPFLDKDLVQEFLWLSKDLKMKFYKSPLHNYLTNNNYPFKVEKQGFSVC